MSQQESYIAGLFEDAKEYLKYLDKGEDYGYYGGSRWSDIQYFICTTLNSASARGVDRKTCDALENRLWAFFGK